MNTLSTLCCRVFICFQLCLPLAARADDSNSAELEFFEKKIRPLLIEKCSECHGEETQESNLRLDTPEGILTGGDSGPVVLEKDPEHSLLISAVRYNDEALQMPPDEKLSDSEIRDLIKWIEMGAPMPEATRLPNTATKIDWDKARSHWAFQSPEEPDIDDPGLGKSPSELLDFLVQTRQKELGLKASPPASKRILIRRAYLDLIGLPPTPEQIAKFLGDESDDAFEKVVDELLASPHYGERWGRHWLDVARYADSNGLDENVAHGNAWRYRDYVIAAFNSDKPFDQFIREQLAGDLLDGEEADRNERLIATGFLSLGPKVLAEGDQTKMQMDIVDEQIDTTGRAFLGLTLGCARCHDHKFDPILTADYYALAGIFQSTKSMESYKRIAKWYEHTIASQEEIAAKEQHDAEIAAMETEIKSLQSEAKKDDDSTINEKGDVETCSVKSNPQDKLKELKETLTSLKESTPELASAMGVIDGQAVNIRIHVRGSHLSLGKQVARRTPLVFSSSDPNEFGGIEQSGRLELANWIASPENPLTARVWVNRVWRWHFGEGLVSTENNFGILGEKPSDQRLLDWLATVFVDSGWSTKKLHRLIMLSETYQQSSQTHAGNAAIDPENRLLWRTNIRRIDAEVFRDSILAVCGQLDRTMGGSLLHVKNREFIFNHTSKDETNYDSMKRSVYLPVIRNNLFDGFSLFDYTDASVSVGDRNSSTVAPQALFALNSNLIMQAAEELAKGVIAKVLNSDEERIRELFLKVLGREPKKHEIAKIIDSLSEAQRVFAQNADVSPDECELNAWTLIGQALLISNEFVYVR